MKIAIFHNYMDNIGGAELVTLVLARAFEADVYTTNVDQEMINKMGFPDVRPISIGNVPINPPFKQQKASWLFRKLNLGDTYDFYIIAGDWAVSGAVNHTPNLWYVHSPTRELWDSYRHVRNNMVSWWQRPIFDSWVHLNRFLNKRYVNHVERFVCNSHNTKQRVKKFLHKDAKVIYPPVDTTAYKYRSQENYWLSVNRLIPNKRIELQMKAFAKLKDERLVVVGSYEQSKHFIAHKKYLESIKPTNVEILHWVHSEELRDLYSGCKGFITTAMDEDFGLTPIEAMASGKPVIACNEGGYKETVINLETGILIDDISVDKLVSSIQDMSVTAEQYKEKCIAHAKHFDTKMFVSRIRKQITGKND